MKKEVMAYKSSKSPISEQFRTLRTNIQFMNVNKKMKVLHITSTFPNEGKSWVSSNLAVTFAQAGKKVILVDSDMRKGRQYAIFGVSPKPGLSNILSQSEVDEEGRISENVLDYIQPTEVENLQIIVAGDVPPNPSELLVSAQMIGVLEELKKISDIVIIDGTPAEIVADSVILSRLADSTVIVTAHKITKKDALDRVIKNIQNVGGNIAGVIINKVPVSSKKYDSRYYYYGKGTELSTKKNKKSSKLEKDKKINEDRKSNLKKEPKEKNIDKKENVAEMSEPITSDVANFASEIANSSSQTWNSETLENTNEYQTFNIESDMNKTWDNAQNQEWNNQPLEKVNYNEQSQEWNNQPQENVNYNEQNQEWNNQPQENVNYNEQSQEWNNQPQENVNYNEQNQEWNNAQENNYSNFNNVQQTDANNAFEQTNLILQQINDYLNKEKNGL